MKLVISQLKVGENPLNLSSDSDTTLKEVAQDLAQQGFVSQGPLRFSGSLHKHEPDYYLQGKLQWEVRQECSRCAEDFSASLQQEVQIALAHLDSQKQSLRNSDTLEADSEQLDVVYFGGNDLNLKPIFHEQFVLSIPYRALCKEDCKGLCQHCGKNLNRQECECANNAHHNPFSVLKTVTL